LSDSHKIIQRCRRSENPNNIAISVSYYNFGIEINKKKQYLNMIFFAYLLRTVCQRAASAIRRRQTKYAIDQGKHVFCEKPAAIDAVGYGQVMYMG